ncbi:hypothetical protein [Brevibacillus reuszeri]|uniref:hypothetical protein n=1 Tax=Brevibacillus reuszeri TaxID=54915 RepID=UPI003D249396
MLDCTKVKTFTPHIPAGTGPTFIKVEEAIVEILADLNQSATRMLSNDQLEMMEQFITDTLRIGDWIYGTYTIFEDYQIEIKTMQQWQLDQMGEFNGY